MAGMLVVLPAVQFFQHLHNKSSTREAQRENVSLMQERELQSVQNFHQALNVAISRALARGDMQIYEEMIHLQRKVPGFAEFSLYSKSGIITYSSEKKLLNKAIDPAMLQRMMGQTNLVMFAKTNQIEIFDPLIATAQCLECHDDFKNESFCGISYFRMSNNVAMQAERQINEVAAKAVRQEVGDSMIAFVAQVVFLGLLILLVARSITKTVWSVVKNIKERTDDLEKTAENLVSASQSMAEGASKQAASVEETSSALEEVSSMSKRTANNAHDAKGLASQAHAAASSGIEQMDRMGRAMGDIKASTGDIQKIIKTIDEIAFQTNILALNAAVEAARFGQAGAGFAVVAGEVRSLAQRSAVSARETSSQIEAAIAKTVMGVQISREVSVNLREIVEKVEKVDQLIAETAVGSNEQSQGIAQVNTAVLEIDKVTQANAASAEESASAAAELNGQANALKVALKDLMSLVEQEIH